MIFLTLFLRHPVSGSHVLGVSRSPQDCGNFAFTGRWLPEMFPFSVLCLVRQRIPFTRQSTMAFESFHTFPSESGDPESDSRESCPQGHGPPPPTRARPGCPHSGDISVPFEVVMSVHGELAGGAAQRRRERRLVAPARGDDRAHGPGRGL